jgi:hypothetical protein
MSAPWVKIGASAILISAVARLAGARVFEYMNSQKWQVFTANDHVVRARFHAIGPGSLYDKKFAMRFEFIDDRKGNLQFVHSKCQR